MCNVKVFSSIHVSPLQERYWNNAKIKRRSTHFLWNTFRFIFYYVSILFIPILGIFVIFLFHFTLAIKTIIKIPCECLGSSMNVWWFCLHSSLWWRAVMLLLSIRQLAFINQMYISAKVISYKASLPHPMFAYVILLNHITKHDK